MSMDFLPSQGALHKIREALSTLAGVFPAARGANGGLKVEGVASGVAQPVSGSVTVGNEAGSGAYVRPGTSATWAVTLPAEGSGNALAPTGGSKTVAATGTAEALVATSTKKMMLYVRAKAANTNNVYFGDSAVDKTTSQQIVLDAGEHVSIVAPAGYYLDVANFYIDVDTNGEGVDFLYI